MKADEFVLTVKLIYACEATKATGLTLFVEADHENLLVMVSTLCTATINVTVVGLH
jgi:hypothetical protein